MLSLVTSAEGLCRNALSPHPYVSRHLPEDKEDGGWPRARVLPCACASYCLCVHTFSASYEHPFKAISLVPFSGIPVISPPCVQSFCCLPWSATLQTSETSGIGNVPRGSEMTVARSPCGYTRKYVFAISFPGELVVSLIDSSPIDSSQGVAQSNFQAIAPLARFTQGIRHSANRRLWFRCIVTALQAHTHSFGDLLLKLGVVSARIDT